MSKANLGKIIITVIAVVTVASFQCTAETIIVDQNGFADYNNIQDAIDYSYDGDTIIVKSGIYPEDIFFNGRAITLTSQDPTDPNTVAATIINGTITFDFGEQEDSILQGFTVSNKQEYAICTEASYQQSPDIYGNIVVWTSGYLYYGDIYGYDLATKQQFTIRNGLCYNPAIYGNIVVWESGSNHDIYGYDLVTEQEFAICTATGWQQCPAIHGNTIVWQDKRSGNSNINIYGYDLVTKQEFAICTATGNQTSPAIYGNTVVWADDRSGTSNWNIYGYDLATKQEFTICTATGNQTSPAIYGNTVVWADARSGTSDIYGYDLATKLEFFICTATGGQGSPAIYGNTVVWGDGNYDIYGYNLETKQEFAICTIAGSQSFPAIYGNTVVWQDKRSDNYGDIYANIEIYIPRVINYGVVCYDSFPSLIQNRFLNFQTALGCYANATPRVQGNIFLDNATAIVDCNATITDNFFKDNSIAIQDCSGTITDNNIIGAVTALSACTGMISHNVVTYGQTGMSNCSGMITDNIVTANTVGFYNCTASFANNLVTANAKGFQSCGGTISNNTITGSKEYALYQNSAAVKNNIIAFNQVGIYGVCSNSYNCFWSNTGGNFANGAYAKTGDFFGNPKFASNGVWIGVIWQEGDYHLKSAAGRYDPNTETWVLDDVNSPCIDAGDPCDSIDYEPNPNGGRINVGNYGGTAQSSKSTNGSGTEPSPRCLEYPAMDFNKDCKVDFQDFAIFTQSWLDCNLDPPSACWN